MCFLDGIFHDTGIHDIDIMLHVLGEYPAKVYVMGGRNVPEISELNDYDYVAILFWFPSGTIGIIDVSRYSSFGYDQRMEVKYYKIMRCNTLQQQKIACRYSVPKAY